MKDNLRIIISGGGTGGHIFPAVSIANAIKEQHPDTENSVCWCRKGRMGKCNVCQPQDIK